MFPVELFRVAVTVQYGPQWDNYPNDFNISKNCISLIINLHGCLLLRNCSIQLEDCKYDNKNGGHCGPLSDNYLLFFPRIYLVEISTMWSSIHVKTCFVNRHKESDIVTFPICSNTLLQMSYQSSKCEKGQRSSPGRPKKLREQPSSS